MDPSFIDGIIVGLLLAIIIRSIADWWRSRYRVVKKTNPVNEALRIHYEDQLRAFYYPPEVDIDGIETTSGDSPSGTP